MFATTSRRRAPLRPALALTAALLVCLGACRREAVDAAPAAASTSTKTFALDDPQVSLMVQDLKANRRQSVRTLEGIPASRRAQVIIHRTGWPTGDGAYVADLSGAASSSAQTFTATWTPRQALLQGAMTMERAIWLARMTALGAENVALSQPQSARRARAQAALKTFRAELPAALPTSAPSPALRAPQPEEKAP